MDDKLWRICAAGCWLIYVLAFLFLPFLIIRGFSLSGMNVMSFSGWGYVPLIAGIIAGVCVVLFPGKIGAVISIVGAFMPLMIFFLARGDLVSVGLVGLREFGLESLDGVGSVLASYVVRIGVGVILCLLAGFGSAVFCFLPGRSRKNPNRSAGLTADETDEW